MQIDFAYVGTARAGSTWLYECLRTHPEICVSETKELNIFTDDYRLNGDILSKNFEGCTNGRKKGIFPVNNLVDPRVPKALRRLFPDLRIIISLRDPVEREWSHYKMLIAMGKLPPDASIQEAEERYPHIRTLGLYHEALLRFRGAFPPHQLFVGIYEDTFRDVRKTLHDVCAFLDVDTGFFPEVARKKVNAAAERRLRSASGGRVLNRLKYGITAFKGSSPTAARMVEGAKRYLQADKMLATIEAANRVSAHEIISEQKPFENSDIPASVREELFRKYQDDIRKTEALLGESFSVSRWLNK